MEIPMTITDILLDIEGTTTPIDFVFKVLFPYAKKQLPNFLARKGNEPEVKEDLVLLREEYAAEVPNPKLPDFSIIMTSNYFDKLQVSTKINCNEQQTASQSM